MSSTRLKPYPGPGSAVDIAVILNALEFHKKQFPYKGDENNTKVLKKRIKSGRKNSQFKHYPLLMGQSNPPKEQLLIKSFR